MLWIDLREKAPTHSEARKTNFQYSRGKSSCERSERYFFNGLQIQLHKNWPYSCKTTSQGSIPAVVIFSSSVFPHRPFAASNSAEPIADQQDEATTLPPMTSRVIDGAIQHDGMGWDEPFHAPGDAGELLGGVSVHSDVYGACFSSTTES